MAPRKAKPKARSGKAATKAKPSAKGKAPIALPEGWSLDPGGKAISLHLKMADFLDALGLMNEVAEVAERLEHHPDFHLERYNRLRITTYSHDVGTLTERDEGLAGAISALLQKRGLEPQPRPKR
jgi:4a-hydroxytetrahydrobiopterin dehydratase